MNSEVVVLLSNFPDAATARNAVRTLVGEHLVACGNIVSGIESIYEWKGTLETSAEVMVVCKTSDSSASAAQARLRALHPYEVPEILQIPVNAGWPDYVAWVAAQTARPS